MRRIFVATLVLFLPTMSLFSETGSGDLVIDRFSNEKEETGIPKGWEALEFKKVPNHTRYAVQKNDGNHVVKATSKNSASGIFKKIDVDPNEYPVISWRWKVENVLEKGDASKKKGDDYAARIYVAFKYDPQKASFWEKTIYEAAKVSQGQYPPKGALNYVWGNKLPQGTVLDNAYTDKAKMVIVQTGSEKVGQWISEERNILEDYKKYFGSNPPLLSFIAIMTDTDNTGESATAYYDDILLKRKAP